MTILRLDALVVPAWPRHRASWRLLLLLGLITACSPGDTEKRQEAATPVTTRILETFTPGLASRITGVAEPYRQSEVGFEVTGRVEYVLDIGEEVRGTILDESGERVLGPDGAPVEAGDVLAVLDSTRYRQAQEAIELQLASQRLGLEAQQIELEQVVRPDLDSARAKQRAAQLEIESAEREVEAADSAFELAQSTLERYRQLLTEGVIQQAQLDESQNTFNKAQATRSQARTLVSAKRSTEESAAATVARSLGAIKLKEAQIEQTRARVAELTLSLRQATTNLEDCVLRAPFDGRITATHVSRGAIVAAGTPVVTLTLLDPIKISVSVSAENDRKLPVGSVVRILPPGLPPDVTPEGHVIGTVRTKSEVADASTRTFRLDIMVRNIRRGPGQDSAPFPVDGFLPVIEEHAFEPGPLFVHPDCVAEDGTVLRLPGLNARERAATLPQGTVMPERVPVVLGEDYFNVIQWPFRRLADPGSLRAFDLLIVSPREEHERGVSMVRPEWVIRPGELIPVILELGAAPPGYYVPVHAIRERNGATSVFLVEKGRAHEAAVAVHEPYRDLRRITGSELKDGAAIIEKGAHFVMDGQPVRVIASSEPGR
ncbi:MAG: efflux RND transporter periplasmic adaptor subunit [Planctomycetota bacterium]